MKYNKKKLTISNKSQVFEWQVTTQVTPLQSVVSVDGVGRTVLHHDPPVQVLAFAGHFKVHLPPVRFALQCSPLQSITQLPPAHNKSQVFEWQVTRQVPPLQVTLQSSPLQFILQSPPLHDKSQVLESHMGLQIPPLQRTLHWSDALQEQLGPRQI